MDDDYFSSNDALQPASADANEGALAATGAAQPHAPSTTTAPRRSDSPGALRPSGSASLTPVGSLSYNAPKIENSYGHIGPRYLDKKKEEPKRDTSVKRETFPVNSAFRSVAPRYTNIPEKKPTTAASNGESEKQAGQKVPTPSPLEAWAEVQSHRQLARQLGFGAVPVKYIDAAQKADRSQSPVSPRRLVEVSKQDKSKEIHWQSTSSRVERTFDDLRKENPKMQRGVSPSRKTAPSPVSEYVRHGTPIKHHLHTTDFIPVAERSGSAGQRNESPSRGRTPAWHSGGVALHHFDEIKKKEAKKNRYIKEEQRLRDERERRLSAVKGKAFVPRVALLAPAYLIPDVAPFSSVSSTAPSAVPADSVSAPPTATAA
jgi:hypothetical protein